jgi:tetratricopeptide (TPR) repeat protein
VKEDAIIFPYADDTFPIWYLLYVERKRQDISAITWTFLPFNWQIESTERIHPNLSFPFNKMSINELRHHDLNEIRKNRLKKILLTNLEKFPLYIYSGVKDEVQIQKDYLFLPDGVFFRLFSKENNEELKRELLKRDLRFLVRGIGDGIVFRDRIVLEIMNNYSFAYNERGNIYQLIDVDMAITEYKKALAITPSYLVSQFNLGVAYANKKDCDRALEIFEKIKKENPGYNSSLLHYGFGLVYQNKWIIDKAIDEYEMALKIDPDNLYAKQMLEAIKQQKISPVIPK